MRPKSREVRRISFLEKALVLSGRCYNVGARGHNCVAKLIGIGAASTDFADGLVSRDVTEQFDQHRRIIEPSVDHLNCPDFLRVPVNRVCCTNRDGFPA